MVSAELPRPAAPAHIGIIMDGNGRWATRQGLPRAAGHHAGARTVRVITEAAAHMGIRQLTLYAFSSENWSRPAAEVRALMFLLRQYLHQQRARLIQNNIRFRAIGRLSELPEAVRLELARTTEATRACSGMTLCLALNYGARNEILDAVRHVASDLSQGRIHPNALNEEAFAAHLYQPDMPPLDLIIRTGGEMRLSNFLLWQAAYAELWVTPVMWPEFSTEHLRHAIADFHQRTRTFGGSPQPLSRRNAAPSSPITRLILKRSRPCESC